MIAGGELRVRSLHSLHTIEDSPLHSVASAQQVDNVHLLKHPHDVPDRNLHSLFPSVFHREEMFIAVDTAFRLCIQSHDFGVVGARAKQHDFTGRLFKELTLSHERWY